MSIPGITSWQIMGKDGKGYSSTSEEECECYIASTQLQTESSDFVTCHCAATSTASQLTSGATSTTCDCLGSIESLDSIDMQYITRLQNMMARERHMKRQIQELEHREKSYLETLRKADEMWANMEGGYRKRLFDTKQSGDNTCMKFQQINECLMDENVRLIDELKDLKLELKQLMEKVQGPLSRQLDKEKRKHEKLEKELCCCTKDATQRDCCYNRDKNLMQNRINEMSKDVGGLKTANDNLKREACLLKLRYEGLQQQLINQKLEEARVLEQLQKMKSREEDKRSGAGSRRGKRGDDDDDDDDGDGDLFNLTRKLSKTLHEVEECDQCQDLPSDLTDTAMGIKELGDIVTAQQLAEDQDTPPPPEDGEGGEDAEGGGAAEEEPEEEPEKEPEEVAAAREALLYHVCSAKLQLEQAGKQAQGGAEAPADAEVSLFETVTDGVNITTTLTTEGSLEVTTEGPEGKIETTLTYTEEGTIDITTEIVPIAPSDEEPVKSSDVEAFAAADATEAEAANEAAVTSQPEADAAGEAPLLSTEAGEGKLTVDLDIAAIVPAEGPDQRAAEIVGQAAAAAEAASASGAPVPSTAAGEGKVAVDLDSAAAVPAGGPGQTAAAAEAAAAGGAPPSPTAADKGKLGVDLDIAVVVPAGGPGQTAAAAEAAAVGGTPPPPTAAGEGKLGVDLDIAVAVPAGGPSQIATEILDQAAAAAKAAEAVEAPPLPTAAGEGKLGVDLDIAVAVPAGGPSQIAVEILAQAAAAAAKAAEADGAPPLPTAAGEGKLGVDLDIALVLPGPSQTAAEIVDQAAAAAVAESARGAAESAMEGVLAAAQVAEGEVIAEEPSEVSVYEEVGAKESEVSEFEEAIAEGAPADETEEETELAVEDLTEEAAELQPDVTPSRMYFDVEIDLALGLHAEAGEATEAVEEIVEEVVEEAAEEYEAAAEIKVDIEEHEAAAEIKVDIEEHAAAAEIKVDIEEHEAAAEIKVDIEEYETAAEIKVDIQTTEAQTEPEPECDPFNCSKDPNCDCYKCELNKSVCNNEAREVVSKEVAAIESEKSIEPSSEEFSQAEAQLEIQVEIDQAKEGEYIVETKVEMVNEDEAEATVIIRRISEPNMAEEEEETASSCTEEICQALQEFKESIEVEVTVVQEGEEGEHVCAAVHERFGEEEEEIEIEIEVEDEEEFEAAKEGEEVFEAEKAEFAEPEVAVEVELIAEKEEEFVAAVEEVETERAAAEEAAEEVKAAAAEEAAAAVDEAKATVAVGEAEVAAAAATAAAAEEAAAVAVVSAAQPAAAASEAEDAAGAATAVTAVAAEAQAAAASVEAEAAAVAATTAAAEEAVSLAAAAAKAEAADATAAVVTAAETQAAAAAAATAAEQVEAAAATAVVQAVAAAEQSAAQAAEQASAAQSFASAVALVSSEPLVVVGADESFASATSATEVPAAVPVAAAAGDMEELEKEIKSEFLDAGELREVKSEVVEKVPAEVKPRPSTTPGDFAGLEGEIEEGIPVEGKVCERPADCTCLPTCQCAICRTAKQQAGDALRCARTVQADHPPDCDCLDCLCGPCEPPPCPCPAELEWKASAKKIVCTPHSADCECLECLCKPCLLAEGDHPPECDCLTCICEHGIAEPSPKPVGELLGHPTGCNCTVCKCCKCYLKTKDDHEFSVDCDCPKCTVICAETCPDSKVYGGGKISSKITARKTPSHPVDCDCIDCLTACYNNLTGRSGMPLSEMDDEDIEAYMKEMEKEKADREHRMGELIDAITKIECVCRETEVQVSAARPREKPNLLMQKRSYEDTLDGLQGVLSGMYTKTKQSDRMLTRMSQELKARENTKAFAEMLNKLVPPGEQLLCGHPDFPNCPCVRAQEYASSPNCPCAKAPLPQSASEAPRSMPAEDSKCTCAKESEMRPGSRGALLSDKPSENKSSSSSSSSSSGKTSTDACACSEEQAKTPPAPPAPDSVHGADSGCEQCVMVCETVPTPLEQPQRDTPSSTDSEKPVHDDRKRRAKARTAPCAIKKDSDSDEQRCTTESSSERPTTSSSTRSSRGTTTSTSRSTRTTSSSRKGSSKSSKSDKYSSSDSERRHHHHHHRHHSHKHRDREHFKLQKLTAGPDSCVCNTLYELSDPLAEVPVEDPRPSTPHVGEIVDSAPLDIVDIRRLGEDSLLVKWRRPSSKYVAGYEILVDGIIKARIHSSQRSSAVLHTLSLTTSIRITIYAITTLSRCQPPAEAIFQV